MDRAFYSEIKKILTNARNKVYQTANFAMVEAYCQIGKSIVEEQNGEERAEYGTGLLKELSKQMTQDFGRGFTVANLKKYETVLSDFSKWLRTAQRIELDTLQTSYENRK